MGYKKKTKMTSRDDDPVTPTDAPGTISLRSRSVKRGMNKVKSVESSLDEIIPFDQVSTTSTVMDDVSIAPSEGDPFAIDGDDIDLDFDELPVPARRSTRLRGRRVEVNDDDDYDPNDDTDDDDDYDPENDVDIDLSPDDPDGSNPLANLLTAVLNGADADDDYDGEESVANLLKSRIEKELKQTVDVAAESIAHKIDLYASKKGEEVGENVINPEVLPKDKLTKLVKHAIHQLDPVQFQMLQLFVQRDEEFCPDGADEEESAALKKRLESLREMIKQGEPTKWKVLHTPLPNAVTVKLLAMYDLYALTTPMSTERFNLTQEIHQVLAANGVEPTRWEDIAKKASTDNETQARADKEKELYELQLSVIGDVKPAMSLRERILTLPTTQDNIKEIYTRWMRIKDTPTHVSEHVRSEMQWIASACDAFPTRTTKPMFPVDSTPKEKRKIIKKFRSMLDEAVYGMETVKDNFEMEMLANMTSTDKRNRNIALLGPAGVGKSRIASTLGKAMGLPVEYITLGSVSSPESINGGNAAWVGQMYGSIVRALMNANTDTFVIVIDEVDKIMSNTHLRGEAIQAALLHLLDPTVNCKWKDEYFSGLTFDLSNVYFVLLMNTVPTNKILANRMRIIQVPTYTPREKSTIISDYIWKRSCAGYGINAEQFKLSEDVPGYLMSAVQEAFMNEKGMRKLETICDKIAARLLHLTHTHKSRWSTDKELIEYARSESKDQIELTVDMIRPWMEAIRKEMKSDIPPGVRHVYM